MAEDNDHYSTLGVARDAEDVVVRAAYKALSQRYHPDKCAPPDRPKAHQRMAEINAAFQVLGDPAQRKAYDEQLSRESSMKEPGSRSPKPIARAPGAGSVLLAIASTLLLALSVAIERKPWWQLSWEFVVGGFAMPWSYAVHWPLLILITCLGLFAALDGAPRSAEALGRPTQGINTT